MVLNTPLLRAAFNFAPVVVPTTACSISNSCEASSPG